MPGDTAGLGLPQIGLDLHGPLSLKLLGAVGLTPPGIVFDGLPDIPISAFQLHFNGAPGGLLTAPTDLCQPPAPAFHTDFTGHNGAHTAGDTTAVIEGCGNKGAPSVSLKLKRKHSRRPRMKLKAHAGINAIHKLSLKLPAPLRLAGGKTFRKGAQVSGDGSKLGSSGIKRSKKKLTLSSDDGAQSLSARIVKGALQRTGRYKRSKLRFPTKVVDASGHTTSLKLKVKVKH